MDDNPSESEDDHIESDSGADYEAMDEDETEGEEQHFDKTLAASHSYMGRDLEEVGGRSVLEAGWRGRVPVAAHTSAVFPGETVPMLVADSHDAATLKEVIRQDNLFGLLCPGDGGMMTSGFGVLCEVFEVGTGEGGALTVKARATQRFRLEDRDGPMHVFARMRPALVRVLPELAPATPHRPLRCRPPRPMRVLRAALSPWPLFLHDRFDYTTMREQLRAFFHSIHIDALPEEPVSLSFWVASNLALSSRDRLSLFVVDDALLRLHMELRFISKQESALACAACGAEVARREHMLAMSSAGVHANYTNLVGYMHDIVTVSHATNARLSGGPSREYSWFPGYAWTILICGFCSAHLGWRFDARQRSLRPPHFFGLCRNYVQPRAADDDTDRL